MTSGSAFMAYACLLFVLALCLGATAVAPSLSIHAGWVPEPVSGFLSGPWVLILMVAAMLIACAKLVSLFLSRRACGNSSCLPVTWQPKSSTRNTYQRLANCSYICSSSAMQSSSSVPADSTVYVSTKAPACPDMPKQQPNNSAGPQRAVLCMPRAPPSLFAGMPGVRSSSDKALTSSDNSTPGREQPLQLIIQLQDNNSASTDASQAATIATLTWKVTTLTSKIDTLQEQLSMISTSGRVKAISAQFEASRRQAAVLEC